MNPLPTKTKPQTTTPTKSTHLVYPKNAGSPKAQMLSFKVTSPGAIQKSPQKQLLTLPEIPVARPTSANAHTQISKSTVSTQRPTSSEATRQAHKTESKTTTVHSKAPHHSVSKRHCGICHELLFTGKPYTMPCCKTNFHFKCVQTYFVGGSKSLNFIEKCPAEGCNAELSEKELPQFYVKKEGLETAIYRRRLREALANPDKFVLCPTPDCQYVFSISGKLQAQNGYESDNICPKCKEKCCLNCKKPFHRLMTCEEKKTSNPDELAFLEFCKQKGLIRCLKCLLWIEAEDYCKYIHCECGNDFCSVCGSRDYYCHSSDPDYGNFCGIR